MKKTTTGSKVEESRAIDKNDRSTTPKGFRKSPFDGAPEAHLDYIFGFLNAAMLASHKAHRKSTRKVKK